MAEPKLDIAWQKDAKRLDVAAGYITLLCELLPVGGMGETSYGL